MKAIEFLKNKSIAACQVFYEDGSIGTIKDIANLINEYYLLDNKEYDYILPSFAREKLEYRHKILVILKRSLDIGAYSYRAIYGAFYEFDYSKVDLRLILTGSYTPLDFHAVVITSSPSEDIVKRFFESNPNEYQPLNYNIHYTI